MPVLLVTSGFKTFGNPSRKRWQRQHDEFIIDIAISRDSHWLLTGSSDKTARLWDLAAEDPLMASVVLRGNNYAVQFVAFTPDSRWVLTASSRTVRKREHTRDRLMDLIRNRTGRDLTELERRKFSL